MKTPTKAMSMMMFIGFCMMALGTFSVLGANMADGASAEMNSWEFDPLGIGMATTGILMIAIPGILIYMGGQEKKVKQILQIVLIAGVAVLFLSPGFLVDGGTPGQTVIADTADFNVAVSEAQTHVSEPSPNHFLVSMQYNQTGANFNNLTEYCVLTATVSRADTGSDPAFTTAKLVSAGEYTSSTASWGTRSAVAKNTDGTYAYTWTDSNSATFQGVPVTVPRLDTMRTDSITLNVTCDSLMPDGMILNHEANTVFDIGGTQITITWRLTNIDNTGGTASP